jgi:hypothetical protein
MHIGLAMSVCMYICMKEFKNCWTDLDEIWYGYYATAVYPKITLFNFLQTVTPTQQTNKLLRWGQH